MLLDIFIKAPVTGICRQPGPLSMEKSKVVFPGFYDKIKLDGEK